MYYPKKKERTKLSREGRILYKICKECGRYKKLPNRKMEDGSIFNFCTDCWKEMDRVINHREEDDNG